MRGALGALIASPSRPRFEIADIFRDHGEAFRSAHFLTEEQRKAMFSIELCRTAALGGHLYACADCGHEVPAYNSCRNRHCPKCQALAQASWIQARKERVLPTSYFHVVFTLPAELRALAQENPREVHRLLFAAASATLLELGRDPARLEAQLGITAVLHTWTRDLSYHPHVHCVVTGGGLSLDGERWVATPHENFLFPVFVLSKLFAGKFLAALDAAYRAGKLDLRYRCADLADPDAWSRLRSRLYNKKWCVYAKAPFGGAEHLFEYLGRYTHRVGISNHRLISYDGQRVHFATKDGKTATLEAHEFIRRFLLHVLPKGFVKIRHYGLFAASNVNTKLVRAREFLKAHATAAACEADPEVEIWRELAEQLNGDAPTACPACKVGTLRRVPAGSGSRDVIRARLERPP